MQERPRRLRTLMGRAARRYDGFMERQGFYIVLSICVLVIVLSAVYTSKIRNELENPAFPEESARHAVQSQSQTLNEALIASQTAVPTVEPTLEPLVAMRRPLTGAVLRGYSPDEPAYFPAAQSYAPHPAVDLAADYGAPVAACADGEVAFVGEDGAWGLCVVLSHTGGLESRYCGLSEAPALRVGDPVRSGQIIAHVGDGVTAEQGEEPHLHLEIKQNGEFRDPITLFLLEGLDNKNTI